MNFSKKKKKNTEDKEKLKMTTFIFIISYTLDTDDICNTCFSTIFLTSHRRISYDKITTNVFDKN